ncbi:MAG: YdeI/OmpD-associated family protein [Candidatus Acidoferrales bacterium]|nr:YdeI/OmpD-associated family protein [Candidatus Acidoferrales bacterium]
MSPRKAERFLATIYRIWMMRHVDVPDEIARRLQKQMSDGDGASKRGKRAKPKYIPVVAIVNGKSARTTLVPAGAGRYRMQINTALRKAARADVGDVVSVELRLDRESRELAVPADLRAGLKRHPKAWKAFEALGPGHRRHIIQWFDSTKSAAARERRLDRAVDHLLERALLRKSP